MKKDEERREEKGKEGKRTKEMRREGERRGEKRRKRCEGKRREEKKWDEKGREEFLKTQKHQNYTLPRDHILAISRKLYHAANKKKSMK